MELLKNLVALFSILLFSPITGATNCYGQCLKQGVIGRLSCGNDSISISIDPNQHCKVEAVQETGPITCKKLMTASANVAVDPQLYNNVEPNFHLSPMGHRYYYSRMNQVFGSCCPTNLNEIADMELMAAWTGVPTGQAWDIGYRSRAFRRDCTFPTGTWPFICTGVDGTHGVEGELLGTLYYMALLTNDATPGKGVWALFGQCWDADTPTDSSGTNSPVSWNVFSLTKEISVVDKARIKARLSELGFKTTSPYLLENTYP